MNPEPVRRVLTVAATLDPRDGSFTPGFRIEEDAAGVAWRTSIGMDGEAIDAPRIIARPDSWLDGESLRW